MALLPSLLASGVELRSVASLLRVVIHHHAAGEHVRGCSGCLMPSQGDTFTILETPADTAANTAAAD